MNDRVENEEKYMRRLGEEIILSKGELETLLGRPITFLSWPGGAYDRVALAVAGEAGYRASMLGSCDRGSRRSLPGQDPNRIRRSAVLPWWTFGGKKRSVLDGESLKRMIEHYKGFPLSGVRLRWCKGSRLLRSYFELG